MEAKVRGDQNVMPAMLKWVHSRVPDLKDTPYMVAYTASHQPAGTSWSSCAKRSSATRRCAPSSWAAAVSANTGPDAVAVVFEGKPRRLCDYLPPLP